MVSRHVAAVLDPAAGFDGGRVFRLVGEVRGVECRGIVFAGCVCRLCGKRGEGWIGSV